jgi:hypothetical protein
MSAGVKHEGPWYAVPRPEAEVECACRRCGRSFGRHVLEGQNDGSVVPIDPAGRPMFGGDLVLGERHYAEPRYGSTRRRKGPRKGTGLYGEYFEGRHYLRVICKCGRNEKLGRQAFDAALFDEEGRLRLRDGVLYV